MAELIAAEEIVSLPAPVAPAAPAEDETSGIPDAVLAIPAFRGLLEGKPAAISVEEGNPSPETEAVIQNLKPLADAGFRFYTGLDRKTGVMFNTQYITKEELEKADKEGKLNEVAPSLVEVSASFNEVLGGAAPSQGATATPPVAAPAVSGPPAPASAVRARAQSLKPGSPTSGAYPGQGRILNAISKPVV